MKPLERPQHKIGKFIFSLIKSMSKQSDMEEGTKIRTLKGVLMLLHESKKHHRALSDQQDMIDGLFAGKPADKHWHMSKAYYYSLECREIDNGSGGKDVKLCFSPERKSTLYMSFPQVDEVIKAEGDYTKLKQWLDR